MCQTPNEKKIWSPLFIVFGRVFWFVSWTFFFFGFLKNRDGTENVCRLPFLFLGCISACVYYRLARSHRLYASTFGANGYLIRWLLQSQCWLTKKQGNTRGYQFVRTRSSWTLSQVPNNWNYTSVIMEMAIDSNVSILSWPSCSAGSMHGITCSEIPAYFGLYSPKQKYNGFFFFLIKEKKTLIQTAK